jgi:hypothetical protein
LSAGVDPGRETGSVTRQPCLYRVTDPRRFRRLKLGTRRDATERSDLVPGWASLLNASTSPTVAGHRNLVCSQRCSQPHGRTRIMLEGMNNFWRPDGKNGWPWTPVNGTSPSL